MGLLVFGALVVVRHQGHQTSKSKGLEQFIAGLGLLYRLWVQSSLASEWFREWDFGSRHANVKALNRQGAY